MASPILIAPSLLAADFARLGQEAARLAAAGAEWLHLDVMDGHFVPNLTIGPVVVAGLRRATSLVLDAHLMIVEPLRYAPAFARAGADWVTFHVEAVSDPAAAAHEIRALGVRPGVSLRPGTPLAALLPALSAVDLVLIMAVEPGFGGQAFQPASLGKARGLREAGFAGLVAIDGGVSPANAAACAEAGVDVLVAGTAVFQASDPAAAVAELRSAAEAGWRRRPPAWPRPPLPPSAPGPILAP